VQHILLDEVCGARQALAPRRSAAGRGEWASQVAGALSGAAPLIIDGIWQRRRRDPREDLNHLRRGRQVWPRLLIASLFGFAVLLLDSVVGLVMYRVARATITLAHGDQERFLQAYNCSVRLRRSHT